MPPPIRSTQRAPLSCTACYARKVKCNREIPCRACISRGVALECRRETVRVRGQVRTGDQPSGNLSYEALLQENARLAALVSKSASSGGTAEEESRPNGYFVDITEQYEKRLSLSVSRSVREGRSVFKDTDIIMPSRECSDLFLRYAGTWTSWVHCAFFSPQFHEEHRLFWYRLSSSSLASEDPLWLALYFNVLASAILFMYDIEFSGSQPPLPKQEDLLQNWYDAALYMLDKGDFMQKTNPLVVQAVAVLGIVATNVGEAWRHGNLWASAFA